MIHHREAPMLRHFHRLKRLGPKYLVIMLLPLAGCAQLPPDYSPNYSYLPVTSPYEPGRVRYVLAPDACLTPDPTDRMMLGPRLPPGCANAENLLAMADRKRDLVQGRKLGPAPAAPAARAAQKYIYGPREPLGAGVGRPTFTAAPAGTTVEPAVTTVSPTTPQTISR
jgi:hypothetical protein